MSVVAVIMAGGKGERFWPKSTEDRPKQFLQIFGSRTMIQHTVDRILPLVPIEQIYVVTNARYVELVKEQLPELPYENIIVEPIGRNTAPCIGLAAMHIQKKHKESKMMVLSADNMILDVEEFRKTLTKAINLATEKPYFITIGIKPTKPETGYGYINFDRDSVCMDAHQVIKFVEKPDRETAEEYLLDGKYLWNSGMFIWSTELILNSFREFLPELYSDLLKIAQAIGEENYLVVLNEEFPKLQSISIDYGIMEKASNIYVYPGEFRWDDVGSWTAVERINPKDELGNVIKGKVVALDSSACIVEGNQRPIALIGLKDIIIVDTDEALLVCHKEQAQRVKEVINKVKDIAN